MRPLYLLFFILVFPIGLAAQNDSKIEKKLSKLFNNEEYAKCQKKAIKINKKYPRSEIPEYYFSKISLQYYQASVADDKSHFPQLKKAVIYSLKLSDNYSDYKEAIQDSLKSYVFYVHYNFPDSKRQKATYAFYTKKYNETLIFVADSAPEQIPDYFFSNSVIDSLRLELVKFAEKQNGVKYKYAGESPEIGFDCSGFTKYVYSRIGIELPHNAQKQSILEGKNKKLEEARPGDLIFFGSKGEKLHRTSHTAIVHTVFEDDIQVIHCVSGGVCIDGRDSSWDRYWKDMVLFVKTLPALEEPE